MLFATYVFRSLLARLRANVVTIISVGLFVAGASLGLVVYLSLKASLVDTAPAENILVMSKGAITERQSRLDLEVARKVALLDGIEQDGGTPRVARELVASTFVNTEDLGTFETPATIRGTDELSAAVHHARVLEGAAPQPGTLQVMIGRQLAQKYPHLKVGGEIHLPGGAAPITGVFATTGGPTEYEVWTPRAALEVHLNVKFISAMTIVADSPSRVSGLVDKINASKELQAQAVAIAEFRKDKAGLDTILRLVLVLLVLLSTVAGSAIATTMSAAVATRMPEFAAMLAIGIRRGVLGRLVILESVLLASIGAVLGVGIAELVRWQLGAISLGDNPLQLSASAIVPAIAVGLGVLVGILAGIAPSLRIRRLDVVSSLR